MYSFRKTKGASLRFRRIIRRAEELSGDHKDDERSSGRPEVGRDEHKGDEATNAH